AAAAGEPEAGGGRAREAREGRQAARRRDRLADARARRSAARHRGHRHWPDRPARHHCARARHLANDESALICLRAPTVGIDALIIDSRRTIMGLKDEAEGKAKEAWGKATGDDKTEAEGKIDQAKGDAKDAVDDVKDAAKR